MKLFIKTLLALSAVTFIFSLQANGTDAESSTCPIQRVVTWQKVRNTSTEAFNPIDNGHKGMLALGPFDQAFADAMDAAAIDQFKAAYGIDFNDPTQAVKDTNTGIYALINGTAVSIPYLNNPACQDIFVTSDSKFTDRVGTWIQISFGRFVIFQANGTFGGSAPNSGAQFQPNSLWFYGYTIFVKKGSDYTKPGNMEIVPLMSYQLGQEYPNQWTPQTKLEDILVPMTILDANSNNIGYAVFPSNFLNIPQGSVNTTTFGLNYGYYQWPGINCLPPNCVAP